MDVAEIRLELVKLAYTGARNDPPGDVIARAEELEKYVLKDAPQKRGPGRPPGRRSQT